jgi:hypothetical protein
MFAAKRATMGRLQAARARHNIKLDIVSPPTIIEAAKQTGASVGSVISAKALRRDAAPEVVEAVVVLHFTSVSQGSR